MNWLDDLKIEDLPGDYQEMAVIIGLDATLKLAGHYGKSSFYFRSLKDIVVERKRKYIIEKFNGVNHLELARATDYSERYIYEILAEERNKRQCKLFTEQT